MRGLHLQGMFCRCSAALSCPLQTQPAQKSPFRLWAYHARTQVRTHAATLASSDRSVVCYDPQEDFALGRQRPGCWQ